MDAEQIGKEIGEKALESFLNSIAAMEKRIYFRVVPNHEGCPANKPYGVIGEKSGTVHGCHATRGEANQQLSGLYAATSPKNGYKPSKDAKKMMETPMQHDKRREHEKKMGMP